VTVRCTSDEQMRSLGRPARSIIIGVWVASRAAAFAAGVRFDDFGLGFYWHFIDPPLLRHNLFQSLYYLHTQPPLFNVYLGLVLHLPGSVQHDVFAASFGLLGIILAISMAALMLELGVPRTASVIVTCIFIVSPAAIVYEHWLFYTYPVATLLVVAALGLIKWLRTDGLGWCAVFAASLAALGLMRSSYHVIWMAIVVVAVLVVHPARVRRTGLILGTSLLLVALVYVKNFAVFDYPAASTWEGETIALATTFRLPEATRARMVADHQLSAFALIQPFSDPSAYAALLPPPPHTGVALLDTSHKADGAVNYDYRELVNVDRHYLSDAETVARTHPGLLLSSARSSVVVLLEPAEDYSFVRANLSKLGKWYPAYADVVEGRLGTRPGDSRLPSSRPGVIITLEYLLAAIGGVFGLVAVLRRRRTATVEQITATFIAFTAAWVTLESLLVDVGENNRFRFEIDPAVIALAASTAVVLLGRARRRREQVGGPERTSPTELREQTV
jgi:hypothetical protein